MSLIFPHGQTGAAMSQPKRKNRDARSALLALLRLQGILHAGPGQPVVDRSGRSASWMFYSWNVSLTAEGGTLAAQCLLERLKSFRATQLATYGTTGIPLLAGCILLGEGKYTGICLREKPKGRPDGRQIEGPADTTQPVVIIDDSLSSGTSLLKGIHVLESHGFRVEGSVCLVHFPHRGGRERAEALGYRVETLFDVWQDLGMEPPAHVPGYRRAGSFDQGATAVEDGLSPAQVARRVAEQLLREGTLPRPPRRFNVPLQAKGGVWVSFRDRRTNVRLTRNGFWHFDANDADACRDVVLATAKTVRTGNLRLEQLGNLKIAVTFFGPLQAIQPSALDFSRYGIVVRSKVWPVKVGGALPNTQVFTSEREQFDLALRNGQIGPFEPYQLFRHTLRKFVEPGEAWLPYGTADGPELVWTEDRAIGTALTHRARQAVAAAVRGQTAPPAKLDSKLIPARFAAIGVTLYHHGTVGCAVSQRPILDDAVVAAAMAAAADRRFGILTSDLADKISIVVSVLHDPEWMGNTTKEAAARKLRLGRDSLAVQQGKHQAVFLDSVATHYDWGKEQLAVRLLRKARATDGPAQWTTYRTAAWLSSKRGAVPHRFGFAGPPAGPCDLKALRGDLALLGRYIDQNLLPGGLPRYAQTPVPGWEWERGSSARAVHGLYGLITAGRCLRRADWRRRGEEGIRRCLAAVEIPRHSTAGTLQLAGQRNGPMADCVLLTAAARTGCGDGNRRQMKALAASVMALFRDDGSIHPDGQPVRIERDNDYLPNAAMLSLASHRAKTPAGLAARLEPYRVWQLRRFQRLHRWGQAGWLPQVCAEVYFATRDRVYADTAFEVVDWCLDQQVGVTGAFLTDLAPGGPTFHTAFIAEAVADAWALALACDDEKRAQRYEQAWYAAMRFSRQLIIRPVDAPCFPEPERCIGGVRGSLTTSTVRIDFVSHLIVAIVKGLQAARGPVAPAG